MNEYAKARVSMEEYLTYQNHEIGKPNNKGFALVDDHDSLFVNLDTNTFTWFARNTGGGLFTLMSELDGIESYEDKVALLKQIKNERTGVFQSKARAYIHDEKNFDLSDHTNEPISQQSRDYLTEVRKINPILVDALARSGLLVDEQRTFNRKNGESYALNNLWYVWKNINGQVVGADAQSTKPYAKKSDDKHQGYWKGVVTGSPASKYGFNFKVGTRNPNEAPDKLVVVEAPVDAISYWQLHFKEIHEENQSVDFLSLSGVKSSVLNHYLKENYWHPDTEEFKLPKELRFAVDNDGAGRKLIKEYGDMIENFGVFDPVKKLVDVPADLEVKDWNDQLRYGKTLATKTVELKDIESVPTFAKEQEVEVTGLKPQNESESTTEHTTNPEQTMNTQRSQNQPTETQSQSKETPVVEEFTAQDFAEQSFSL